MRFLYWLTLSVLFCCVGALQGCTPTNYTNGVPNLVKVKDGLWRSGQPTTDAEWQYLKSLGIYHVVKLNFASEGSDDGAIRAGMTVHTLSIQPDGDINKVDDITNLFVEPDPAIVAQAIAVIRAGGGVLVHCTHGWDRTGVVIYVERQELDGWGKERAWKEMIDRGFHVDLLGLLSFALGYHVSPDAGT